MSNEHGSVPIRNEQTGMNTMTLANAKKPKELDLTEIAIEVLEEKLRELESHEDSKLSDDNFKKWRLFAVNISSLRKSIELLKQII